MILLVMVGSKIWRRPDSADVFAPTTMSAPQRFKHDAFQISCAVKGLELLWRCGLSCRRAFNVMSEFEWRKQSAGRATA
jgi:hypothetical protein